MNTSICFSPKTILNKVPYFFSKMNLVSRNDIISVLFAVIIITLLGAISHQNYGYSCYIESPSQISKKISILLFKKNLVVQNLRSQNPEHAERRELIKSQIESALFTQKSH